MRKYVIMGVQGSGKGTQSQLMAAELDLVHISVGDIFRWNVQRHTKMGAQVRRIMASGELVGDDLVESVISERLAWHDWNYGFIIDGFPRNRPQAEFFLESYDIDGVIHLDLPDSEVRRRVLNRRMCARLRHQLQPARQHPSPPGQCDACGGRAGHQGGRHRGGAGGPAAGLPREDQPGARPVPAQGVRHHRGRQARARRRPAGDQAAARPPAAKGGPGAQPRPGTVRCVRSRFSVAAPTRR